MIPPAAILGLVTAERLAELVLARRNTRRLIEQGGQESGAEHYPLIVGLHAAWLVGLWALALDEAVRPAWLALFIVVQGVRAWTLLTIGSRWTTRIITVPGETLVRRGPYRFFPHPNYAVVVAEIALLPLVFGLWSYALAFSVLNASILWIRIRAEEAALREAAAPRA